MNTAENEQLTGRTKVGFEATENLSRAGRYFNNARKGYANTMKELEAAQSKRKAEEKAAPKAAEKPEQNQPVGPKLVSFRQSEVEPHPIPEPAAQTDAGPEPNDLPEAA